MNLVAIDRWRIKVDAEATAAAYLKLPHGEAVECGCRDCQNWTVQRNAALPFSFLDLLKKLGVDPEKETELSEFEGGAVDPTLNLYTGEYLFIGHIEAGPDCFEESRDGKGANLKLESVLGDLKVGFSSNLRWAMGRPRLPVLFPGNATSVLVFQVHARRGALYA